VIEIPLDRLEKSTLSAVIEEFVLREGTDYGPSETSLKQKIEQVKMQLHQGDVVITFDPATENCTLLTSQQFRRLSLEVDHYDH
jgi:hypothetical protein